MPKPRLTFLLLFPLLLFPLLLPAGCVRSPTPLPPPAPATVAPPSFVAGSAQEAIPRLIAAERKASRTGDLPLLAQLWAEDGRIIDSRATDAPSDDFIWPNRAAILDRYRLAVFPAPPPPLAGPPAPAITVQGDTAEAVNGHDRWRFVQRGGRWWIAELRY